MATSAVLRRELGLVAYEPTLQAMQDFTDSRNLEDPDQLWLLQHPRVFTQGQAGKAEHVLAPGDIPVIQVDRGGQVTDHGPGQWVLYLMLDLRRRGCSYHGLSLNVDMDLEPFGRINPCGHRGLEVTSMARLLPGPVDPDAVGRRLLALVADRLDAG